MSSLFEWSRLFASIPKLTPYLVNSLEIVLVVVAASTILGILLALLRLKRIPVLQQMLGIYISAMRGTPVLVQIFLVYYGLPVLVNNWFGVDINSWDKIVYVDLTFIINMTAFMGEIFRGALESIPREQWEAGYSVGMTYWQTFVRVILPQAVKAAIPAYGADVIELFHNTSLATAIGAADLLGRAKLYGVATSHKLEPYLYVILLYVIISFLLKWLFKKLDQKFTY